ncbi:MAG: hypothetical protein RPU61_13005 [Candidatus Sedimenticola sp. (ex Thyasira tokunagai)]
MSVISNAKEIADLIKKLGDVELYRKIIELEGQIIEITREKHSLEERTQELSKTLQIKDAMQFKQPFYYQEDDAVPFCAHCWEVDNLAIHIIMEGGYNAGTRHHCHKCNTEIFLR